MHSQVLGLLPRIDFQGLPEFPTSLSVTGMPDRHSELLRQRALVLEHLAWLDREIASVSSGNTVPPDAATAPAPITAATPADVPTGAATPAMSPNVSSGTAKPAEDIPPDTEVILEQYRVEPAAVKQDVRKGCLLYFVGAFVLLGIVVAVLYFAIGTR